MTTEPGSEPVPEEILLTVVDDDDAPATDQRVDGGSPRWKIMIVDDEQVVHDATRLALSQIELEGRPVELLSAFSAEEGFRVASENPDIALALVDVVMETTDAGLVLVKRIREELGNNFIQLVVRTGQPGYAPEETVVTRFAINAYITKSDLTRARLLTVLATSIRSYMHLRELEESREGLAAVVDASARLMQERSVADFASGVLNGLSELAMGWNSGEDLVTSGLFAVSADPMSHGRLIPGAHRSAEPEDCRIVAARGPCYVSLGCDLSKVVGCEDLPELGRRALAERSHIFDSDAAALYLSTPAGWQGVLAVNSGRWLAEMEPAQLDALCLNVELGLENSHVFSRLERIAYYDATTDLLSPRGLERELEHFAGRHGDSTTVYVVGLDRFSDVVGSFGSAFGSEVIVAVRDHLQASFGTQELLIGRLHADVVAMIVGDPDLAQAVLDGFDRPLRIGDRSVHVAATVGVASVADGLAAAAGATGGTALLDGGETALYAARDRGDAGFCRFDPVRIDEARERLDLVNDLRRALNRDDELFMRYQPKVRIEDGQIVGFEALVRWQCDDQMVRPDRFLAAAGLAGLHAELDLHIAGLVADMVCEAPDLGVPIAVNVTPASLQVPDFADRFCAVFERCPGWHERIEIEVTEEAVVLPGCSELNLARFVDSGVRLALDDFGTGYSSISYLLRLPIDTIKVDGMFVVDIVESLEARRLMGWVLELAGRFDKEVVIECVESSEQIEVVSALGAKVVQGYFYSRPVDADIAVEMAGAGTLAGV